MNIATLQLIISVAGIAFSWVASFYGAKIAIARVEEKLAAHASQIDDLKKRIDRLETPHFKH